MKLVTRGVAAEPKQAGLSILLIALLGVAAAPAGAKGPSYRAVLKTPLMERNPSSGLALKIVARLQAAATAVTKGEYRLAARAWTPEVRGGDGAFIVVAIDMNREVSRKAIAVVRDELASYVAAGKPIDVVLRADAARAPYELTLQLSGAHFSTSGEGSVSLAWDDREGWLIASVNEIIVAGAGKRTLLPKATRKKLLDLSARLTRELSLSRATSKATMQLPDPLVAKLPAGRLSFQPARRTNLPRELKRYAGRRWWIATAATAAKTAKEATQVCKGAPALGSQRWYVTPCTMRSFVEIAPKSEWCLAPHASTRAAVDGLWLHQGRNVVDAASGAVQVTCGLPFPFESELQAHIHKQIAPVLRARKRLLKRFR